MSGVGKSTVLEVLGERGYLTVDTDYDGWELADGLWDGPRMTRLLDDHGDVVVSGTVSNQIDFYDRFDHVVLLSAPIETLLARVAARANNPYGRTPEQRAEIRHYTRKVEPLLRRGATCELDGRRPVEGLADSIEALLS
jgi:shikimate kinase